jgi:hypothetical protein
LPESTPEAADSLPDLLNIDTANWDKLQTWLLAALRPKGPFPVLIIQGPGGSGKSTAARIIRALLDPVAAPLHPLPSQEGQVMQLAYRNRILAFDHVTRMSNSVADALCRLSTGTCVTIRLPGHQPPIELDLARPILITANENFKPRPDLARRAITIELEPLANPQPLDEVLAKLAQILPNQLAALYTRLASTLANHTPHPEPPTLTNLERTTPIVQRDTPEPPTLTNLERSTPIVQRVTPEPPTTNHEPPTLTNVERSTSNVERADENARPP